MYQKPTGMLLATILYMVESKLEKEAFWYASKMPSPRNGLLQDENGVRDQLVQILQVSINSVALCVSIYHSRDGHRIDMLLLPFDDRTIGETFTHELAGFVVTPCIRCAIKNWQAYI
ncbi:hypothetical protein SAY87_010962 [Trapa incisa]|uniref:Uncharacterized protein n=1 Tax=Trapa incisa TaxID=236973 RepID=A0AAN7GEY0_9MYRT|nr:hypothetical protein SAY87_010962 [Trapa incisa]